MTKLIYDSLYKFMVSVGLVIILAPYIIAGIFINSDSILISAEEYEELSLYSKSLLEKKEYIISLLFRYKYIFIGVCLLAGAIVMLYGIINWMRVQKDLDEEIKLRNKKQYYELGTKESLEKIEKELETGAASGIDKIPHRENSLISTVKIENRFFEKLLDDLSGSYDIKKNVRVSENIVIDFVAVSKYDDTDILYELKGHDGADSLSFAVKNLLRCDMYYRKKYRRSTNLKVVLITSDDSVISQEEKMVDGRRIEVERINRADLFV